MRSPTSSGHIIECQSWMLRRCLSYANRLAGKPHRPREPEIREILEACRIVWSEEAPDEEEEAQDEEDEEEKEQAEDQEAADEEGEEEEEHEQDEEMEPG